MKHKEEKRGTRKTYKTLGRHRRHLETLNKDEIGVIRKTHSSIIKSGNFAKYCRYGRARKVEIFSFR